MVAIEAKKQIVIDNYFKTTCDVNTSIKEAFTKGFEVGLTKAVFPKADYEARLKADMVAMLKEISKQIEEEREDCLKFSNCYERFAINAMAQRSQIVIKQKINSLKGDKE